MNNILIKTLNILMKNIDKYNVNVYKFCSDGYDIHYLDNSLRYNIEIKGNNFTISINTLILSIGHIITSEFTNDVTKAEIFLLVEKLKSVCEDYTSTKFRLFVDNDKFNNNGIDD